MFSYTAEKNLLWVKVMCQSEADKLEQESSISRQNAIPHNRMFLSLGKKFSYWRTVTENVKFLQRYCLKTCRNHNRQELSSAFQRAVCICSKHMSTSTLIDLSVADRLEIKCDEEVKVPDGLRVVFALWILSNVKLFCINVRFNSSWKIRIFVLSVPSFGCRTIHHSDHKS